MTKTKISSDHLMHCYTQAIAAMEKSYSPYSGHAVGAVIIDENGKTHRGCNIEAAHYKGICAEGAALASMILGGGRIIKTIVTVGPDTDYLCTPCGDCRQRIREFSDEDTEIISLWNDGRMGEVFSIDRLLPVSFGPDHIRKTTFKKQE